MSKLNVNAIEPSTGTDITLGASGDTLTVPSGATLTVSGTMNASSITAGTLAIAQGGTGAATLAAAGLVNTPSFSVYKATTGQSIDDDTETVLVFDTEVFDSDNNFASNKFTPTTAGKYYLEALITYPTASDHDDCAIRINKNGSNIASLNIAAFHYETRQVSVIVEANGSSDYFEGIAYHNRGSAITLSIGGTGRNYFSGFKLIGA